MSLKLSIIQGKNSLLLHKIYGKNLLIGCKRYLSTENKSKKTSNVKYNKSKKNRNFKKDKIEISYEEESDIYLLKELNKVSKDYLLKNKKVSEIADGFKNVLEVHGFEVVKSPLMNIGTYVQDMIHLRKVNDSFTLDLLMDYRKSSYSDSKEVQLIVTNVNRPEHVLYMMGDFSKTNGFLFSTVMILNTSNINRTSVQVQEAICNGDGWIFKALNNHYQKVLDVHNTQVVQFLNFQSEDVDFPDFDESLLIDALVNYTVIDMLGCKSSDQDGEKLRAIMWMLGVYCENAAYGKWIHDLKAFFEK